MKKSLLILFCMIFVTCAAVFAAKLPVISVQQTISYQGSQYADTATPVIGQGSGPVNLKYYFTVEGKDNNKAVIDCRVVLPADFDIRLLSAAGIQKLETKDNSSDVAALTTFREGNNTIVEFLIPQETNGKRFIEFQFDPSKLKAGREIPIRFEFTSYRTNWFKNIWPTAAGGVAGGARGALIGGLIGLTGNVVIERFLTDDVPVESGKHASGDFFISPKTMNEILNKYISIKVV